MALKSTKTISSAVYIVLYDTVVWNKIGECDFLVLLNWAPPPPPTASQCRQCMPLPATGREEAIVAGLAEGGGGGGIFMLSQLQQI